MIEALEHILGVISASGAAIILYLGLRSIASMRLVLQRRSVILILLAAFLFVLEEALGAIATFYSQPRALIIMREVFETAFIICLAVAVYWANRSERHEIKALHDAVNTDPLTKLYNVSYFRRSAPQRIKQLKEEESPLSLLILDIDNFKQYNDVFGHEAGTLALQVVAETLHSLIRTGDLVARYGGEEFVILMAVDREAARAAAERIRATIELNCAPNHNPALSRQITVSIGVSPFTPAMATLEDLIEVADQELYRAKQAGKNVVSVAPG